MSVPVKPEPPSPALREVCACCGFLTRYWAGNGHVPICRTCGGGTSWHELDKICEDAGYPPFPTEHMPKHEAAETWRRRLAANKQSKKAAQQATQA